MMNDYKDKVVLVTGASTGIGAAVATGFANCGAKVAIHYGNSEEQAQAVQDEITKAGGTAKIFQADVRSSEANRKLISDVVAEYGRLDVVVSNAGGLVKRAGLQEITNDLYDEVMNLNVRSVMELCSAAIPHLIETQGNVIITGSLAAHVGGGAGASIYAAAKAAVHNMVRAYAKEFAEQGVRFNAVSPGTIYTLFHQVHTPENVLEGIKQSIPLKRLGTPDDCVGTYLYLGSNALSGYVTGQAIEVNGGQLMP
ncbi:SDR family oxidoreductase [Aestuariirhabdus sp. Z084]|uniref:SDR family NAD(P)-dependent oxidoreductase n=1 Tax=Aestuariirhabdus haliotis TaxID=2918751 RepID=UPI00201B3B03|nr:SDR family oxidoreductase [Aestuariirhabdus haliotis]MCL6415108.1 SDR family oxidoreductase [Aestuariirhabdus haliotis]MCL6419040.1 SDR family oxidoreductase [Aestuariirhabdus haliotis]